MPKRRDAPPETLAKFLAPIIWADGVYADEERETVKTIAEAYGLNPDEFSALVDAAVKEVESMNEEQVNEYLETAGEEVFPEERGAIYEAAMEMALCDGVLAEEEVANLLALSEALSLEHVPAILLLCDMMKSSPEIEIQFAKK